jgi:hypothetical protein
MANAKVHKLVKSTMRLHKRTEVNKNPHKRNSVDLSTKATPKLIIIL